MKNWEQCSDSDLLLDARTSADPFGVFYARYFASVLAFFRRRVPGPEEAFDLTAETFAAALSSVPRFRPGPEPPPGLVVRDCAPQVERGATQQSHPG